MTIDQGKGVKRNEMYQVGRKGGNLKMSVVEGHSV